MNPTNYGRQAEQFWQAETRALYLSSAGLESDLDLESVYEQYGWLFSREVVLSLLERARESVECGWLAAFAALRYLQGQVAALDDELFAQMADATISWDGKDVPFFASERLLVNEPDAGRRRALYAARGAVIAAGNPIRQARWEKLYAAAWDLNFPNYRALCDRLRKLDLKRLEAEARRFLKLTAPAYRAGLEYWWPRLVGDEKPEPSGLFRLMRGGPFDSLFPAGRLVETLSATAAGLGFPLERMKAIDLDCEARPGKMPRAFCAFLRVPDEIKLVTNPRGGCSDYRNGHHELGHALHGANISAASFGARYLGDDSVGEAWAFLLENLTGDRAWLMANGLEGDLDGYAGYDAFIRLVSVRRACAQLLYELELHGDGATPDRYSAILGEHLEMDFPSEYCLSNVDDGFYIAQYLRGWALEAQVQAVLVRKFGPDWFRQERAGEWLRGLWISGQPDAEAISLALGYPGLELVGLAKKLLRML